MKRSAIFALLSAFVTAFVYLPQAHAKGDPSGWVGGLFGLSVPNKDNTTARLGYGITAGAKVGSEFGVGGYFLSSAKDESEAGTTAAFNYDLYGIEGAVHFEGEAKGVYLGGRVGVSKVKAGTLTTSPAHWGLVAGYNHMLTDNLSLGAETNFMSVASSSGTPTGQTGTKTIDAFTTLNFLATVKLWF